MAVAVAMKTRGSFVITKKRLMVISIHVLAEVDIFFQVVLDLWRLTTSTPGCVLSIVGGSLGWGGGGVEFERPI